MLWNRNFPCHLTSSPLTSNISTLLPFPFWPQIYIRQGRSQGRNHHFSDLSTGWGLASFLGQVTELPRQHLFETLDAPRNKAWDSSLSLEVSWVAHLMKLTNFLACISLQPPPSPPAGKKKTGWRRRESALLPFMLPWRHEISLGQVSTTEWSYMPAVWLSFLLSSTQGGWPMCPGSQQQ